MKGRELRQFALECLKAAQESDQVIDQDAYRMIAERLVRRAGEIDQVTTPMRAPARLCKARRAV